MEWAIVGVVAVAGLTAIVFRALRFAEKLEELDGNESVADDTKRDPDLEYARRCEDDARKAALAGSSYSATQLMEMAREAHKRAQERQRAQEQKLLEEDS